MDIHTIHNDIKLGFHSDATHAREFLQHGMHRTGVQKYLDRARDNGKSHFFDPTSGYRFTIEHDKENDTFSVRKSESQH